MSSEHEAFCLFQSAFTMITRLWAVYGRNNMHPCSPCMRSTEACIL